MSRIDIHHDPGPGVHLRGRGASIWRPIGSQAMNQRIDHLLNCLDGGNEDFTLVIPEYQRGRVWTDAQAAAFVGFLLEGGRVPTFYLREVASCRDEVVDGQQRLFALLRFAKGELAAVLSDGRRITWADFDVVDRRAFMGLTVPVVWIREELEAADVLRIYLRLNRGGTPHTDEEIARVEAILTQAAATGRPT